MNRLMHLKQKLSYSVKTYTPELWFPLTIVVFKGIAHILNTQYIYAQLELPEIPRNIQIATSIFGGFSVMVVTFISWFMISLVIFYWCELFYDVEGTFRNFFEIAGICHLVLLVGTLVCSLFIIFVLPDEFKSLEADAANAQELLEAITEVLSPLNFIGAVGNICFGLLLVVVVRVFFEIKWLKAFSSIGIPYALYWVLSKALQSVFQPN